MKLSEKVVLITGGGSGVGAAIARVCAREGARVVVIGRDEVKLKAVCDCIGRAASCFAADVTDRPRVKEVVDGVIADRGRIDILVNNAGVNVVDRALAKLTPENWDLQMDINVTGSFNLIHAVLPHMRQRREGTIISISSLAGTQPSVLAGTAYSASKHGMSVLTKMVDLEESVNGIRATVISPGEINTPILDQRPVKVSDEHKARILQPEDIGEAVLYVGSLPPRVCIPEMLIKPLGQTG
ncbi:MAG TPA: SDR family oxidoreductase [Candidatus Latescibacteria bacterium]|nr:SDR family oxidoreductase [Candidatus Latescibacterota bacterium]